MKQTQADKKAARDGFRYVVIRHGERIAYTTTLGEAKPRNIVFRGRRHDIDDGVADGYDIDGSGNSAHAGTPDRENMRRARSWRGAMVQCCGAVSDPGVDRLRRSGDSPLR